MAISVSDPSNFLLSVINGAFYQGDESSTVNTLMSVVLLTRFGTTNSVTYTIDFGRAGEGLNNFDFKLSDVDRELGNF